ncbi:MAG: septal ring lytic transglycosylase RlpA family protein [Actinomycetota bacterium]
MVAVAAIAVVGITVTPGTAHHRVMKGKAVYYSNEFKGDTMACGGDYRPRKMVAAHRRLPCGTQLRVKNRATGKVVTVTVKDRGPYGDKDTKVDVSRRAARRLGFWRHGSARVRMTVRH